MGGMIIELRSAEFGVRNWTKNFRRGSGLRLSRSPSSRPSPPMGAKVTGRGGSATQNTTRGISAARWDTALYQGGPKIRQKGIQNGSAGSPSLTLARHSSPSLAFLWGGAFLKNQNQTKTQKNSDLILFYRSG